MKEYLEFKSITFDTIQLQGNVSSFPLFEDNPNLNSESITRRIEDQIARWLFSINPVKELILCELQIPLQNIWYDFRIAEPITNPHKKPGDIDILICEKQRPDQSIAIQCKRIKVTAIDMGKDKVSRRIADIADGVLQANGSRDMGFYKTYLVLLVVIDGRNRDLNNILSRGSTPRTLNRIYDFPGRGDLYSEIGIVIIEIVQPTSKGFTQMAQVNVCVLAPAKPLSQLVSLTNRVKYLLKNKGIMQNV